MDPKEELVKNWLDKAHIDLESAKRLASGPDPIFDTAVYHCQQAAEKAIKGWLVQNDQRFEKIHDLRVLV
jgi:HEPN domain-containing protein